MSKPPKEVHVSKEGVITDGFYPEGYTSLLVPDGNAMYGMGVVPPVVVGEQALKQSILIDVRERESLDFIARMQLLGAMEGVDPKYVALFVYLSTMATELLTRLSGLRSRYMPFTVAVLNEIQSDLTFKKLILSIAPHVQSPREQRALLLFWYEIELSSRMSKIPTAYHIDRFTRDTDKLRSSIGFADLTLAERDVIRIELREQQRVQHNQKLAVEGVVTPLLPADKKAAINKVHQQQKKARATKSQLPSAPGGPAAAAAAIAKEVIAKVKDNTHKNELLQSEYLALLGQYQDKDPRYGMFSSEEDKDALLATRTREASAFIRRMAMMVLVIQESGELEKRPDATDPWYSASAAAEALFNAGTFDLTIPFSVQAMRVMGMDAIADCLYSFARDIAMMSMLVRKDPDASTDHHAILMLWMETDLARTMFVPGHAFNRKHFVKLANHLNLEVTMESSKNKKRNEKKRERKAAKAAAAQAAEDKPASQA